MLSDEERAVLKTAKENYGLTSAEQKILVNLIEKQSKEIEELKEKNRQEKMRIVQLENEITARIEDVNKYFTPNDKIKEKIEEVKDGTFDAKIVLQSLLEKEKILNRLFQKNN